MHRSTSRRDDTRNPGRRALPPRKAPHGEATPATETIQTPEKPSRKSIPLKSSTNKAVASAEDATRLPSAPSQWKMGRSLGPADENDDWILNQQAPSQPSIADRPRSRTRTSSAGGLKHKTRSEEKKPHAFLSRDDTAILTQSNRRDQVPPRHRRNTDAQTRSSGDRNSAVQDMAPSLKRRISWGKNKKATQEEPLEDFDYKRASQLGLPALEKELVPSLRDTVHKMTGERQASNDTAKQSRLTDISSNSYAPNGQNFSTLLSPPAAYERPKSPVHHRSNSPLPSESLSMKPRQRTRSSRTPTYYDEPEVVDHEPSMHKRPITYRNDEDLHAKSPRDHELPQTKPDRRPSLKTPRAVKSFRSLSPNGGVEDSASESGLRTPQIRSPSTSHLNPLLSAATSPAKMPSNIPTPRFRPLSPSSATRGTNSPSLPQPSANSPGTFSGSRSPALPSEPISTVSRSRRPSNTGDKSRSNCKQPLMKSSQAYGDEDAERTPKASRVAWNKEHESTTESDSTSGERVRTEALRYPASYSRSASTRRSPNPTYSPRQDHSAPLVRREQNILTEPEESASDASEHDALQMNKAREDSHLRRKNELVGLVAGFNLDLRRHNHGSIPTTGYANAKRGVLEGQTGYSRRQDAIDIARGASTETGNFIEGAKRRNAADYARRKNQDSSLRGQQDGARSRPVSSQKRVSSTLQPDVGDQNNVVSQSNKLLKPDSRDLNRDSLLMLNADLQREAFGIPRSVSDMREGVDGLLSAESNTSLRNQTLESEWEGEAMDGLGLSHGAEQLFHALGIGADAHHGDIKPSKKQRTSWRSSMAEAEKYLSENICPAPAPISASSSISSIYEDDIPDRPWQRRERDLDRVQTANGSSIKSSWKKTLSHSAYVSLLERHGEIEMRRQEVIWELCETEQAFLKSLRIALKVFVNPLLGKNRQWASGLPSNISRLLDWLEDIFQLHAQISSALQHARSSQYPVVLRIAETLRTYIPKLEVYQPYIVRLDEVIGDIEEIMKDPHNKLGEFFRLQSSSEECAGMSFISFLWLPLTRLGRYLKHFNELWSFTPCSHADHLPTFALLHSAMMVVRVMREVKLREEEYEFVKELLSRIQGFPNVLQLVRRERRLIAHGALQRVHASERAKHLLEGNSDTITGGKTDVHFARSHLSMARRRRANSLDSCLSDTASMSSISSAAYNSSLHGEGVMRHMFPPNGHPTASTRNFDTKTTSLYAFVFSDLAVFASFLPRRSNDGKDRDVLELLDDIGICRVLSVVDHSGNLGYDHLVAVHVLPVEIEQLESGILSDVSATSLFIHLPSSQSSAPQHSDVRRRWWTAFERCCHFTLRSLSFPAHSGKYLARGSEADQDENTRQTVMGILASGLPLPKSPSVQVGELERSVAQDASLREREERGWWALRFQQTLHEMQRDDLPLLFLQKTSTMLPPQSSGRKTVSGRRRLKLTGAKK